MNILIAIMGDTFGRVATVKERSSAMERIDLIFDFIYVIDFDREFDKCKYVLLVEQSNSNSTPPNSIEGRFTRLQSTISSQLSAMQ